MSEEPPNRGDAQLKWLGVLVMVVGALIALLCGLCTLYVSAIFVGPGTRMDISALAIPLIVGGIPILTGIGMFGVGVWMFVHGGRRARK